jgi:serine/threonine protein kinase/Tol biopolymer transport system component
VDPLRWKRIGELFAATRQLDGERRIAFLEENCGQDEDLFQQVKSLLDIDENPGLLDSRPTASTLGIPQIVASRFRIIRYIAEGGMGTVYEAEDLQLHDHVALKTIRRDIASNPKVVERFKQEIRLGKRVTHPNVCRIHDLGTDRWHDGAEVLFLTMQFLVGETLSSRITRGPIPKAEALPLIEDMADALSAAHEAEVIHRDFKSGNVMLVPGAHRTCAVITDFGLARGIRDGASRWGLVGTVDYMAPEQITGGEITPATDIYALGVVMYEMVTGRRPFTGDSRGDVAQKHLHDEPRPPRELSPHLDANWNKAILGCLRKLPSERLQSAAEVKEALVQDGDKARSRFPIRRKRITSVRLVALSIAASATVFALLALAIGYLRLPVPPPRISEYVQVTRDGERKSPIGTDGNRLYLNLLYPQGIGQVPISGGQIAQIPVDLPNVELPHVWLRDVSPDGSSLLVWNPLEGLFVASILGHPVRHLANGFQAAWSPDGKWVAYSTQHGEIYLIRSEGGEPHLLVSPSTPVTEYEIITDLSWSPDGGSIRFTRDQALWQVTSTGSNLHQLLPRWNPSSWKCCGVWTPDGEIFLFVSGELNSSPFHPGAQLWAIEERGGRSPDAKPVQLTSGPIRWGKPIPARDGRKIFARGVTLRGELVRYDRQSDQLRPYLGGISAEFVTYSSDGESMAYVSFPDGVLWRANRDGTGVVQLTEPPFYPKFPRWSPDGKQILFTDLGPNRQDVLYVVSVNGGTPKRVLPEDNGPQSDGNWSPDGKKVLYQPSNFSRSSGSQGKAEFRILDLASHTITTVPGSEGMYWPRWSPDGRSIAGVTRNTYYLRVFDMESQQWRTLENVWSDYPIWGHDSRYLYFMLWIDHPGVFRIPASGGKAERILDLKDFRHTGWFEDWMGLDPTDTPMLLRDKGTDDIYALTLERK